jgi:hypothetical protein
LGESSDETVGIDGFFLIGEPFSERDDGIARREAFIG